jgi:chromosome partitioning protein
MPAKPQVVGILKQKGGAGATTVAIHLAAAAIEAGRRPVVVDTDPQHSASSWREHRTQEEPQVVAVDVEDLPAVIREAADMGYNLVIVDTPPHSGVRTTAVGRLSDVAVIPTRPDALDLAAMPAMLELVETLRKPYTVVLNACPYRAPEVAEARASLEAYPAPVWTGQLGLRRAYSRAISSGQAVTEVNLDEKASAEIRELWAHIAELLTQTPRS